MDTLIGRWDDGKTDRQTDRWANGMEDRQMGGQMD